MSIAILKELLATTAIQPLETHRYNASKCEITLQEPEADYAVTVFGLPDAQHTLVIKADSFVAPDIFQGTKGERKRADFIIVAQTEDKPVIVCIEMKAGKHTSTNPEIIQQLKGAACFMHYCQSIGRNFWGETGFLEGYEYRFVKMIGKVVKRRSRYDKSPSVRLNDTPENMLEINLQRVQFSKLIGAA